MRLLFSISYNPTIKIEPGTQEGHRIDVAPRACDWGKTGWAKHWTHIRAALAVLKQARHYDALVLCTAGIEAFLVARLRPWFCPRTRIVCFDLLMPRPSRAVRLIGRFLKRADHFLCIRTGDIETLNRRFGVPPDRCSFVPFPADPAIEPAPGDDGYIYSAGAAHRDWPTLLTALTQSSCRAILSPGGPMNVSPDVSRIEVLPSQSPEQGRRKMAQAKLVVLTFEDTDLPSGPLVLLDAMAMGKAVIATNVNGTRDYIDHGRTGLLVPPRDPDALAAAIRELMDDDARRTALGAAARQAVTQRFTQSHMLQNTIAACESMIHRPNS